VAAAASTPSPPAPLLPGWAPWALLVPASLVVAQLTLSSVRLAATVVAVACTVAVYLRSRRAGLAIVWLLWLLFPAVRRLFALSEGYADTDPLALAPFLATAIVAAIELTRARLGHRAKLVLGLAAGALAFGVPIGLLYAAKAAAFALVAYGAALLAFAIGYRESRERPLTLFAVLAVAAVPIALYAIAQILAPLTTWDDDWLRSVNFVSVGSKADGSLRAFGTLNAPGTLALVMGLAVVGLLTVWRMRPVQVVGLLLVLAAMSLTLVRGVWVSLAVALLVLLAIAPWWLGRRVLVVGLCALVAVPVFVAGNPASGNVADRATSLTSLESDTSANARIATPQNLVPVAIREPLGVGLGQAGEASRLQETAVLRATDNAYLSLLLQLGPVGLILMLTAVALGGASAVRNVRRHSTINDLAVVGGLALLAVLMVTADAFYGVSGVALWYLIGFAVRGDEVGGRGA
jgi:hypothetical protein